MKKLAQDLDHEPFVHVNVEIDDGFEIYEDFKELLYIRYQAGPHEDYEDIIYKIIELINFVEEISEYRLYRKDDDSLYFSVL